jgi:hypothetical protein
MLAAEIEEKRAEITELHQSRVENETQIIQLNS